MAAVKIPFRTLCRFGSMIFTSGDGGSLPANVNSDSQAVQATPTVDRPRAAHPTNPYGVPVRGYSGGALKSYTSTWTVDVQANDGLSVAASYAAVEGCYADWYAKWLGTHTHKGITNCTGQLGDLTCLDAGGAVWRAEAELSSLPVVLRLGEVFTFSISLTFSLTEDWVQASTRDS